jgi:hypothetical protein
MPTKRTNDMGYILSKIDWFLKLVLVSCIKLVTNSMKSARVDFRFIGWKGLGHERDETLRIVFKTLSSLLPLSLVDCNLASCLSKRGCKTCNVFSAIA